jgi:hypothetical protein
MMTKNALFAVALLSLALCAGCATGGGGHSGDQIQVKVNTNPPNQSVVGVTLTVQFTATVTGTSNTAVTWSLTQNGTACTGTCGTIGANGLYTAPATQPNPATVSVTATSQANPTKSDAFPLKVLPITVTVTPGPAIVGVNLQQQFTATVTPDAAPQTVDWTITDCPAGPCGTVDANGLYTAPGGIPNPANVSVQATSTIDPPNWSGKAKTTIVISRLAGTYAFRFSGYDSNNKPIAAAGNFVANDDGTIQGGSQDELTAAGHNRCTILATSTYALDANNNNHGTITLRTSPGFCVANTRKYNFVLNASGDGQMIEFDSNARGSGLILQTSKSAFNDFSLLGSFVFGLTGVDLGGKRAGSAGFFQADGAGHIGSTTPGLLDINDNAFTTSSTNITGSYAITSDGSGTLTLIDNDHGAKVYQFAVYMIRGKTQNDKNPLTLFAISTDPLASPAVAGTIVFQDPNPTYDKSTLNNFAVSNLTGVDSTGSNTSVSLTVASGNGNGGITGTFDANNAGTIIPAQSFSCTYSASGKGRYEVTLLGNGNSCGAPALPFVFYASAANRGFLLDKSSTAVMTGTMDPQGASFAPAELAGSFDAATVSSGTSGVTQVAMNLLMTSVVPTFTLSGTRDETDGGQNSQTFTGAYSAKLDGTGKIKLTVLSKDENYVIYLLDNPNQSDNMVQHFVMMNVDPSNTNSSIIFAER